MGIADNANSLKAVLGETLRGSAARHLGSEASHALKLRQLHEELLPTSYHIVGILAELAGLADPHEAGLRFAVPYVVLLTHCDLLDAAVDGELSETTGLLEVANTLSWFWAMAEEEILPEIPSDAREPYRLKIANRLAERSAALRIETARRRSWEPPNEDDAVAAAGRSIGVVLCYELLCGVAGLEPSQEALNLLCDYLHTFQLGDDLGDWESDLASGNHTALLRGAAARLGPQTTYQRGALAREIFLGGYYETYTAKLIQSFDSIIERLSQLDDLNTERLRTYIASKRGDAYSLLSGVVQSKVEFLRENPG